ncbi:MAG: formylglycine-generating enzyme family protein [Planctomycetota bacterium]|nr:MAG: formylglycine-generating enzyme family protein [Planctomycetota bacterium]
MPPGNPPATLVPAADAATPGEMRPYSELVPGAPARFDMVPIAGGTFSMGSPEDEGDRKQSEGPQHEVAVEPFWMGRYEVTWDEYHVFMLKLDLDLRKAGESESHPQDKWADAVSRPTPPYVPMNFGMAIEGCPATGVTQLAAKQYTKWLSMKTGRFYRLPSEAEWEYACRAGTKTAYSFGDDPDEIDDYAWHFDNAGDAYHPVGEKKPNPWGLYDMHGNVAEWVLDRYDTGYYATLPDGTAQSPIAWPAELYPRVVRGGSWDDDPDGLRSAARLGSKKGWKVQDPQLPKSIWYHTDASFVGFRVVRPLHEPTAEEKARYWEPDLAKSRSILERQRTGAR